MLVQKIEEVQTWGWSLFGCFKCKRLVKLNLRQWSGTVKHCLPPSTTGTHLSAVHSLFSSISGAPWVLETPKVPKFSTHIAILLSNTVEKNRKKLQTNWYASKLNWTTWSIFKAKTKAFVWKTTPELRLVKISVFQQEENVNQDKQTKKLKYLPKYVLYPSPDATHV